MKEVNGMDGCTAAECVLFLREVIGTRKETPAGRGTFGGGGEKSDDETMHRIATKMLPKDQVRWRLKDPEA